MIDFKFCRKCPYGKYMGHKQNDQGEFDLYPSVECSVEGEVEELLLMNSEVPSKCPYHLEHKLVTQNVPKVFADRLSGDRRKAI
jgi:hypothetical protein